MLHGKTTRRHLILSHTAGFTSACKCWVSVQMLDNSCQGNAAMEYRTNSQWTANWTSEHTARNLPRGFTITTAVRCSHDTTFSKPAKNMSRISNQQRGTTNITSALYG